MEHNSLAYQSSSILRVFIGGLPHGWEEPDVEAFMKNFGQITHLKINRDPDGRSKGYGFANLKNYINPAFIYGRHRQRQCSIEIKELIARNLYLVLTGLKDVQEKEIVRAFSTLGYKVDFIELIKYHASTSGLCAKVTLAKDVNVKHLLQRKYIEIQNTKVECLETLDRNPNRGNTNLPMNQNQRNGKKSKITNRQVSNQKQHRSNTQISSITPEEYKQKPEEFENELVKHKSSMDQNSGMDIEEKHLEKQTLSLNSIPINIPGQQTSEQRKTSLPNSTQSSEENVNNEKSPKDGTKGYKKLSFAKGKHVEGFIPQDINSLQYLPDSNLYESSQVIKNNTTTSTFQTSRLNPASSNWVGPNVLPWGTPFTPQAILQGFSPFNYQEFGGLGANPYWANQNGFSGSTSSIKKQEKVIAFYTFPGRI